MSRRMWLAEEHPARRVALECVRLGLGVAAITASSWIAIPVGPVPITLQTLAVLLIGATYGTRRASSTVLAWLSAGAFGAPVFADGAGGSVHLLGHTGGYLLAFLPAAWAIAWASERGWLDRFLPALGAFLAGSALILAFGFSRLAMFIGPESAWSFGVAPFVFGGILKAVMGAALVSPTRKLIQL
ncbi:MAG: biotin transporter BioY, partial [Myxococcota bacterium]